MGKCDVYCGEQQEPIYSLEVPDKFDSVNRPSHYQGKYGLEVIDVVRNFAGDLSAVAGFYWGNVMKYTLRFQHKNGLEDLKKARKNLDWLIEEMESTDGQKHN